MLNKGLALIVSVTEQKEHTIRHKSFCAQWFFLSHGNCIKHIFKLTINHVLQGSKNVGF